MVEVVTKVMVKGLEEEMKFAKQLLQLKENNLCLKRKPLL